MEKHTKDVKELNTFTTDDIAALDTKLCDEDETTFRDYIVALAHSNGSPLIHHVDKADRFTDPHLRTCGFMVFPESKVEAETRMGVLLSEVSQETNEKSDHWFTPEVTEKMQQIT